MGPQFTLLDKVELDLSGEKGIIVGAAQCIGQADHWQVKYKAADGRQVTDWFLGRDLVKAN